MALLARLQATNLFKNCTKWYVIPKNLYHGLTNARNTAPVHGIRSYFKFAQEAKIQKFRIKDNVGDHFILIYRNTMYRYMFAAQLASYIAGGVVMLGFIIKGRSKDDISPWSKEAVTSQNEELGYMLCLTAFLVILQLIVSRTPLRIYKLAESKKYVTVSYGACFNLKKHNFKQGQLSQLPPKYLLPWKDSAFVIDNTREKKIVFLLEPYFRRPSDLPIMLGQQKDPDLEE